MINSRYPTTVRAADLTAAALQSSSGLIIRRSGVRVPTPVVSPSPLFPSLFWNPCCGLSIRLRFRPETQDSAVGRAEYCGAAIARRQPELAAQGCDGRGCPGRTLVVSPPLPPGRLFPVDTCLPARSKGFGHITDECVSPWLNELEAIHGTLSRNADRKPSHGAALNSDGDPTRLHQWNQPLAPPRNASQNDGDRIAFVDIGDAL